MKEDVIEGRGKRKKNTRAKATRLLDLTSQFTSGSEDQSLAVAITNVNALEDTNGEGGSLTGTRL